MWGQNQSALLREEKIFFPPLRIKPSVFSIDIDIDVDIDI